MFLAAHAPTNWFFRFTLFYFLKSSAFPSISYDEPLPPPQKKVKTKTNNNIILNSSS